MKCPQCKRDLDADKKQPWRPFCSRKCKLVDFGHWLDELGLDDESLRAEEDRNSTSGSARLQ